MATGAVAADAVGAVCGGRCSEAQAARHAARNASEADRGRRVVERAELLAGMRQFDVKVGTGPVIEHQNVGFMLADIKMRIEACRYLTWKACHDFERTGGRAEELAIMTKVYCSEAAVDTVYDCMRVVGIASYTKDLAPLEKIMRDAMVFPLYDGGNQGVRRRQLHDIMRHPGYDSMLAARGEGLPGDR